MIGTGMDAADLVALARASGVDAGLIARFERSCARGTMTGKDDWLRLATEITHCVNESELAKGDPFDAEDDDDDDLFGGQQVLAFWVETVPVSEAYL